MHFGYFDAVERTCHSFSSIVLLHYWPAPFLTQHPVVSRSMYSRPSLCFKSSFWTKKNLKHINVFQVL